MRALFIIVVLFFCFGNRSAFADQPSTNAEIPGNQGYVYGSASTSTNSDTSTTDLNPVKDIANAVWKLDAWIKKNLW